MINNAHVRGAALGISFMISIGCDRRPATPPGSQGVIELDERVLGFEVPGRIDALATDRGQVVDAGQKIASLDAELEVATRAVRKSDEDAAAAQLALLKAGSRTEEIRSTEAQVRAAKALEDLLTKNTERERALRARNASTDAAVEDLEGRLAQATAQRQAVEQKLVEVRRGSRAQELSAAEARLAAATAAVKLEDERIARHTMVAPLRGLVLDVHAKVGEVVGAGTPVVTIADARHPYTDVFVPEGKLAGLKVGVRGDVRVDGDAKAYSGVIETVAQRTEFTPRYLFSDRERPNLVVRVRVRIDDPGEQLHSGVPAFVTFAGQGAP
jgi:HlyD family secretion protein